MSVSVDKNVMNLHFSLHAAAYDSVTPVQADLGKRLLQMAQDELRDRQPQRILELGCGTGRLTRELRARFPQAEITAVDMSVAMLDIARARAVDTSITWLEADAEQVHTWIAPDARYDLIISNTMIQWLDAPLTSIRTYLRYLTPQGLLAISTFGKDTFKELRASFAAAEHDLARPPTPRTLSMLNRDDLHALAPTQIEETHVIQWFPSVRDFVRTIKLTGASLADANGLQPVDRALFQRFRRIYEERFHDGNLGGIPATYHCLYFICTANA